MNYVILMYLLRIPMVLLSLSVHEFSHGLMAYKLGDQTAKNFGRLTLNPIKHIDLVGLLMMIVVGFGYAKPVPVNTRYFKHPRSGMALTAAAGPISNILLSIISIFIFNFVAMINPAQTSGFGYNVWIGAMMFFVIGAELNLFLALFNLIPIPPLDGSRIAFMFLPTKWYFGLMKYERYIMIGFMAIVIILHRVFNISIVSGVSMFFLGNFEILLSKIPIFAGNFNVFVNVLALC